MTRDVILAIDQGTTNTKALLVDSAGLVRAEASRPVSVSFPRPGWVEQDPLELWRSVREAIDACLAGLPEAALAAVAIANQRESVVAWDRHSGEPIGPVITWQCRRTSARCDQLKERGEEARVRASTGLTLDPLFSATKAAWLLDETPGARRRAQNGELCIGTVDSWILWNLTGGKSHRCDLSNASRTQLLDLRTAAWDPGLLELFGIPAAALPEVLPSSAEFGETAAFGRLPQGLPIAAMAGDSHAALFGQAGFRPGVVKATYGTGSSLMSPTASLVFSERGLSSTIAWAIGDEVTYALEGNISVTGSAVQWLAELLGLPDSESAAALAAGVASSDGVYVVPAFVGLGAPHWASDARGLVTGITRGTTAAHIARAVLEAIAFQVRDVCDALSADIGREVDVLLADGGATRNELLMQIQADLLGRPVVRNHAPDLAALGAAYLAGLTVGTWGSLDEIEALPRTLSRHEPALDGPGRARAYAGWRAAVARCLFEPSPGVTA